MEISLPPPSFSAYLPKTHNIADHLKGIIMDKQKLMLCQKTDGAEIGFQNTYAMLELETLLLNNSGPDPMATEWIG